MASIRALSKRLLPCPAVSRLSPAARSRLQGRLVPVAPEGEQRAGAAARFAVRLLGGARHRDQVGDVLPVLLCRILVEPLRRQDVGRPAARRGAVAKLRGDTHVKDRHRDESGGAVPERHAGAHVAHVEARLLQGDCLGHGSAFPYAAGCGRSRRMRSRPYPKPGPRTEVRSISPPRRR